MEKIKIICIVGPTASGKTSLSVELANRLGGEIISADSMQIYRGMPIATAAISEEEKQGIPHYLVECFDADENFSVAQFVKLAKERALDIAKRGKLPIIAGGTGLFIDSFVNNISFSDVGVDEKIRKELDKKTNDERYSMLLEYDEKAALSIHKNNRKRVIRALELYYGGTSKTQQNEESKKEGSPFEALYIGINYKNRENLYQRINKRVDIMAENGLLEEAKEMLGKAKTTSAQAIGHKELKPYFEGSISLDEALDKIKQETRHYAKRQITWFKRNEKINWLYADEMQKDELISSAFKLAENFLNQSEQEVSQ